MKNLIKITESLFLREIDELLAISPVISTGEYHIHISDIILTKKDNISLRFLYPSCEIVTIEEKLFDDISKAVVTGENIIIQESTTIPKEIYSINLSAIQKTLVFVKLEDDKIVINDTVFTTSMLEFKGSDLLTNKKGIFLNKANFDELKSFLLETSENH